MLYFRQLFSHPLCTTLCDPMYCSTPGLPIAHHLLPKFAQVHVQCIGCHPAISSSDVLFSSYPQSFPASGIFPMSHLFDSDDPNTGTSALASVLPVSIQGGFPLRFTGFVSLLCKGLSGVFSSTTV